MLIYKHQCIDRSIHLWIAMLLVYLLISQLPAQFIISIVLLGQAISILGGKLTNHNFHLFLFLGSSEARRRQMESCPKMHFPSCRQIIQALMFLYIVLYCIVSINLYSASCSAHQSEALPVRETQREESSLERTKRRTWHTS